MYRIKLKSKINNKEDHYGRFGYDSAFKTWWINAFQGDRHNEISFGGEYKQFPSLVQLLNILNRLDIVFHIDNETLIKVIVEDKSNTCSDFIAEEYDFA